jgi:hypothetical protein
VTNFTFRGTFFLLGAHSMSSTDGLQGRLGQPSSDEFGDYQAISTLAVASLLVGAASATALVGVPLWIVPLVGILLSCLALVRIDRSAGTLVGRPLALAGLGLAVCFGTAALAAHLNFQHLTASKAQQVASQWFQALAQGEPEVAHQWTLTPTSRAAQTEGERLKSYYEDDEKNRGQLARFVGQKLIADLLHLGTRAHVEPESTRINRIDDHLSFVSLVYRVTSDEAGKPARFLIELTLEQRVIPGRQQPRWTVRDWKFVGP